MVTAVYQIAFRIKSPSSLLGLLLGLVWIFFAIIIKLARNGYTSFVRFNGNINQYIF